MAVRKKTKKTKVTKKKSGTSQVSKKKTTKKKATQTVSSKKKSKKSSDPKKKLTVYESKVKEGKKVPRVRAEMTGEQLFDLKDFSGKIVVLYFYPKDSTPGCTTEGQDFTRLQSQFKKSGAEVFGVSRDSMKSHERFKEKQNYSIDLISDPTEEVCAIFGAIKLKNMYGKQVRGIDRSTYVIDENGKLAKEWRNVKVPGHAEEVLEFVKSM